MKIIIIGGGIAGLSAAYLLCQVPNLQVEIYEKENDIGGQARSQFGKECYVEYSWRIFGQSYDNLNYIIKSIGADHNFTGLIHPCIINRNQISSGNLNSGNLFYQTWKLGNLSMVNKLLGLTMICKDRAVNEYDHINAYSYFEKNPIVQTILGPFLGLDANKVSLSSFMKNVYSTSSQTNYNFSPSGTRISKYPTQQSLFLPWKHYLINRGVKIYTNAPLEMIVSDQHQIQGLQIGGKLKGQLQKANQYIFACSLPDLLEIGSQNPFISKSLTFSNLKQLKKNLQLYFTINIYFSEELGGFEFQKGGSSYCSEMVLVDMPWKLIIQKKRHWKHNYLNNCNRQIKDVWNVGFLDNNIGLYHKKILSQCSKQEATEEGLFQLKNSLYIKNLLKQINRNFDDIFIGVEDWYQFVNDPNGHLISLNPKFSVNVDTQHLMPKTNQPIDLPQNMFLAGYYVQSTMGGVSMETSCENGLRAGKMVLQKLGVHSIKSNGLPITHKNEYLSRLMVPFVSLDKLLYKSKMPPLTNTIAPLLLIIIYFLLIVTIMIFLVKFVSSSSYFSQLIQPLTPKIRPSLIH